MLTGLAFLEHFRERNSVQNLAIAAYRSVGKEGEETKTRSSLQDETGNNNKVNELRTHILMALFKRETKKAGRGVGRAVKIIKVFQNHAGNFIRRKN